jgi:hypothetical protein
VANLSEDVKIYIIQQLAMYKTPQETSDAVKEAYGKDVPRQSIFAYHPDRGVVSEKHRVIFAETRKRFLETVSDIPIANQAYRIQQLQDGLEPAEAIARVNEVMVLNILEQAAKEVGGMFTNTAAITGANGKPLFDNTEIARAVFNDLINLESWKQEDALKFVAERYKVPEAI